VDRRPPLSLVRRRSARCWRTPEGFAPTSPCSLSEVSRGGYPAPCVQSSLLRPRRRSARRRRARAKPRWRRVGQEQASKAARRSRSRSGLVVTFPFPSPTGARPPLPLPHRPHCQSTEAPPPDDSSTSPSGRCPRRCCPQAPWTLVLEGALRSASCNLTETVSISVLAHLDLHLIIRSQAIPVRSCENEAKIIHAI
jgi:hypothetical protein